MAGAFLDYISDNGLIVPERVAECLNLPLTRLAQILLVDSDALTSRSECTVVQVKLNAIAQIIGITVDFADDEEQVIAWFKHQAIPGFGVTAEQLLEADCAALVIDDLERMAEGVYS